MVLTQEERDKFAAYLEESAASDEAMIRQAEKIFMPPMLIERMRAEMMSAKVIAKKLRSLENMTL